MAVIKMMISVVILSLLQTASPELQTPEYQQDGRENIRSILCHPCRCTQNSRNQTFADCDGRLGKKIYIPSTVPNETYSLSLRHNSIEIVTTTMFRRFRSLSFLSLAENELSSVAERSFENQASLVDLDLQSNNLLWDDATFKPLVFYGLRSLQSLKLNDNLVQDDCQLPSEAFAQLPSLQTLYLDALPNMTFGPGFADLRRLENLIISGHNDSAMGYLYNHTFENVTSLRYLNISNCGLLDIEPDSFGPLRNLRSLDLSNNPSLGFDKFSVGSYGLRHSPLEVLKLNFINYRYAPCIQITKSHLQYLRDTTSLREIELDGNRIQIFERGALLLLPPTVTTVSAQYNSFTLGSYVLDLRLMPNLSSINIGDKGLNYKLPFPPLKDKGMSSFPMSLEDLQLVDLTEKTVSETLLSRIFQESDPPEGNNGDVLRSLPEGAAPETHVIMRYPVPPNITDIQMRWLKLFYHLDEFGFTKNKLKNLDFSYNIFSVWKGPVHGVETVEVLDLSSNFAHFINVSFFQNFRSLKVLNISNNFMEHVFRDDSQVHVGDIFSHLPTLEVLDASACRLTGIGADLMKGLTSLREFKVSENPLLADFLDINFTHAVNLQFINFSRCNLITLKRDSRNHLDWLAEHNGNISIDITFNPLTCNCWNLWFLKWLGTTKVKLSRPESIFCIFPDGAYHHLRNMTRLIEEVQTFCEDSRNATLVAGLSVGIFIFVVIIAGCVVFRYRWKLYYLYYVARNQSRHVEAEGEEQQQFLYDAFIVFDPDDSSFVQEEMRPRLERDHGLRLCLDYRDLRLGRSSLQGAVEAIHNSRRTVCLLTASFLDSRECRFVFEMARMESVHEDRDVVLFVLKDHVVSRSLPRDILYYIKTESYVEFPRDPRCVDFFWDNLVRALRRPTPYC